MASLAVEIWSDVVCPWCYLGKRRFENALARFPHRDEVNVRYRSFELDPTASNAPDGTPGANTFDAHRLLQLAADRGVQPEAKERLMRAYFTESLPVGDHETLVRLAAEAGLDADEAKAVLDGDRYTAEVREDEHLAQRIGIQGVPFFVLGRRFGVSGAQPAEILEQALERAWEELIAVD
jgi:predicted DsbA family dithiol-disulfide isomerase